VEADAEFDVFEIFVCGVGGPGILWEGCVFHIAAGFLVMDIGFGEAMGVGELAFYWGMIGEGDVGL
jgi:hypothetical protein